jgi:lipid-binding SYLF domain-containing protein
MPIARWSAAAVLSLLLLPGLALAKSAEQIDAEVDASLETLDEKLPGAREFVSKAKGLLVFPEVIEAGLFVGGEYGEGALRINGETVDYYNTVAGSFGFQLGAQAKIVVIAFLTQEALDKFRASSGWEAGVDGSIAIIEAGAGASFDTTKTNAPIAGFVIGRRGLMVDVSLQGSKFTRIQR